MQNVREGLTTGSAAVSVPPINVLLNGTWNGSWMKRCSAGSPGFPNKAGRKTEPPHTGRQCFLLFSHILCNAVVKMLVGSASVQQLQLQIIRQGEKEILYLAVLLRQIRRKREFVISCIVQANHLWNSV